MGETGVTIFGEIVPKWEAGKYVDERKLVRPERFELPTYSSGGCRSIQLSYGRAADSSSLHRSHGRLNVAIPVETGQAPSLRPSRKATISLRPLPSNPASACSIAEPSCAGAVTSE